MKNRIIIILVLISYLGFGQNFGYGDQYKDQMYFNNKTKLVTFYNEDNSVYKTLDLKKESPIDSTTINANIVNGYLLVTFFKYTNQIDGVSQMYIYDNKGEKLKTFPKTDEITYSNPHITKDFKLLQYGKIVKLEDINVIYNMLTDTIIEERVSNSNGIIYQDNFIILTYRISLNQDETIFYSSDLIFKKITYNKQSERFKIYNNYIEFKNDKSIVYFKDLDDYVVKE